MSRRRTVSRAASGLALSCLLACAATGAPERKPPKSPDIYAMMQDNMAKADDVRIALIDGDVVATQTPAALLAHRQWSEIAPSFWTVHIHGVEAGARRTANAYNLNTAAAGFATMVTACAGCHRDVNARLSSIEREPAGPVVEPTAHMYRLQWAADRMWEGLLTGSESLWQAGATVAAEPPSPTLVLVATRSDPANTGRIARLITLGSTLPEEELAVNRPHAYGEYVAACGTCHQQSY